MSATNDRALDIVNELRAIPPADLSNYVLDRLAQLGADAAGWLYCRAVSAIADDVALAIASGEATDGDEARSYLEDSCDGTEWVCKPSKVAVCLANTSNIDAYESSLSDEDGGNTGDIDADRAWHALRADVLDELKERGIDLDAVGQGEEETADAE